MARRSGPTKAEVKLAAADPRFIAALGSRNTPYLKWADDAACRDRDPELFFPDPADPAKYQLSICADCPVRSWCLAEAIRTDARHGVRNSTEYERAAMTLAWAKVVGKPKPKEEPAKNVTALFHPPRPDCVTGHALTGDNLAYDSAGRWYCVPCRRAASAKSNDKQRAAREQVPA